jgi:uncharacterized membrane protein (Fun14 family)
MTLDPTMVPSLMSKLVNHFLDMHRWQKSLLTLAVIVFGTGTAHQMTTWFGAAQPPTTAPIVQGEPPPPAPTVGDRISPWAMRIGASFILGFIIGFALRIFVRITMTILVVGGILLGLAAHFNWINVDWSAERAKYEHSIHEVNDEATHYKDVLVSHLPHSGSGVIGAFAGFKRRKLRI